jgi:hypothetical protein
VVIVNKKPSAINLDRASHGSSHKENPVGLAFAVTATGGAWSTSTIAAKSFLKSAATSPETVTVRMSDGSLANVTRPPD